MTKTIIGAQKTLFSLTEKRQLNSAAGVRVLVTYVDLAPCPAKMMDVLCDSTPSRDYIFISFFIFFQGI